MQIGLNQHDFLRKLKYVNHLTAKSTFFRNIDIDKNETWYVQITDYKCAIKMLLKLGMLRLCTLIF